MDGGGAVTLVLYWKTGAEVMVIADTLFHSNGQKALDVGPKLFSVPIKIDTFANIDDLPRRALDMGFAFAGFTAAGQMTHALASAGLQNLVGDQTAGHPSVKDVAAFYARCAVLVVEAMRQFHASDIYLFEGVILGWEGETATAFSFEVTIDANGRATSAVKHSDFNEFGLYAIGRGSEQIQEFIDREFEAGRQASPYDALLAVIEDERVPTVGGSIQAGHISCRGFELKPVLWSDGKGMAEGGFMGFSQYMLGNVGEFTTLGTRPIAMPRRWVRPNGAGP